LELQIIKKITGGHLKKGKEEKKSKGGKRGEGEPGKKKGSPTKE